MNNSDYAKKNAATNVFNIARGNLLTIVILTCINIFILMTGSSSYFLFSALVPYFIAIIPYAAFEEPEFIIVAIFAFIAFVILVPYFLAWLFSKKHPGWLIFSLIYFSIDCLFMAFFYLLAFDASCLIDIGFHIWALIGFIRGVGAIKDYKNACAKIDAQEMAADNVVTKTDGGAYSAGTKSGFVHVDTEMLRFAGYQDKEKVYLKANYSDHEIVYRKYGKGCEELVVDGKVYGEFLFSGIAKPHTISATVDGLEIEAGYFNINFIKVNGEQIARSTRWI